MTTYQLPPPERLQFDSDTTTPGFTEPLRYNTKGHSRRMFEPKDTMYRERQGPPHREHLPSVSQLLTPASQSKIPHSSYAHEQSPSPLDWPSVVNSGQRSPVTSQTPHNSTYHYQPKGFPQAQRLPIQSQSTRYINVRRDEYQSSPSAQHFSTAYSPHQGPDIPLYSPYSDSPHTPLYPRQARHMSPPSLSQPQQTASSNIALSQPTPSAHASSQYYDYEINADLASGTSLDSEESRQSPGTNVKPLPRLIGEGDVPGEGPSWFYEDGTTCRKVIDGELVNAQWGVTKAGRPRKRLAIACTTCREKKIKCDPAEPKCVQCEKFGKECIFTTAMGLHGV